MSAAKISTFIWGLLALFLVSVATAFPEQNVPEPLLGLHDYLSAKPLLSPLLFVAIYALAVTLFLPGTLFCLLGGALFGPWLGGLLNVAGATLGASLAFLTARHLAAALVERHLGKNLQQLKRGVEQEGWRFVALIRLLPMVPYDLSSYTFGLCRIPLGQFASATALALLPRLTVYAYIGHNGLSLLRGEADRLVTIITSAMLLIAVLLLPQLYARIRRPLDT